MEKKKRGKLLWGRVFDFILIIVFPILAFLALLSIFKFSKDYTIKFTIGLVAIYFVYILSCKCKNKFINFIRRLLFLLLTILLFFTYNFSSNIQGVMRKFNDGDKKVNEETITMDLITLKDSYITNVDDIGGLSIGYNQKQDKEANDQAINQLSQEANSEFETTTYDDYTKMINDLYSSNVSAVILPQTQLENNKDFPKIKEETKIIKSYDVKVKVKDETASTNNSSIDITKDVFTVYLSANDDTGQPANKSLSDMNMLMIINPKTSTIDAVSIPRDSFVPNPGLNYGNDKLTHTGSLGVDNTVKAVENMFQIKIDFYAKISFDSLIKIVDEIGGIDVDVKIKFCEQDENRSFKKDDMICLDKGEQHLSGKQALAYARHRHSYENQDLGRNQAQIRVIKGIVKKLLSPSGISKIDNVLDILPDYVITNISDEQISSMVKKQIDDGGQWSFNTYQLNTGETNMDYTASYENQKLSVYYLSPTDANMVNGLYNMAKQQAQLKDFEYEPHTEYKKYSKWNPTDQFHMSANDIQYDSIDDGFDENGQPTNQDN